MSLRLEGSGAASDAHWESGSRTARARRPLAGRGWEIVSQLRCRRLGSLVTLYWRRSEPTNWPDKKAHVDSMIITNIMFMIELSKKTRLFLQVLARLGCQLLHYVWSTSRVLASMSRSLRTSDALTWSCRGVIFVRTPVWSHLATSRPRTLWLPYTSLGWGYQNSCAGSETMVCRCFWRQSGEATTLQSISVNARAPWFNKLQSLLCLQRALLAKAERSRRRRSRGGVW